MERHNLKRAPACDECKHCMTDDFAADWCLLDQRSCEEARSIERDCGPSGILFEAKP